MWDRDPVLCLLADCPRIHWRGKNAEVGQVIRPVSVDHGFRSPLVRCSRASLVACFPRWTPLVSSREHRPSTELSCHRPKAATLPQVSSALAPETAGSPFQRRTISPNVGSHWGRTVHPWNHLTIVRYGLTEWTQAVRFEPT